MRFFVFQTRSYCFLFSVAVVSEAKISSSVLFFFVILSTIVFEFS